MRRASKKPNYKRRRRIATAVLESIQFLAFLCLIPTFSSERQALSVMAIWITYRLLTNLKDVRE